MNPQHGFFQQKYIISQTIIFSRAGYSARRKKQKRFNRENGVEIMVYDTRIDLKTITLNREIPCRL
jgi:hypothetical protein